MQHVLRKLQFISNYALEQVAHDTTIRGVIFRANPAY